MIVKDVKGEERFFIKKHFRIGYTCASSLKTPLGASSVLVPLLLN